MTMMIFGLGVVAALWCAVSIPLFRAGVRKSEGQVLRALPWALGIGVWSGVALGSAGFVWAASIPADNAGEAAVFLFGIAFVLGGTLATLVAWWRVVRSGR